MIFNTIHLIISLIIKNIVVALIIMAIITTSIMGEASLAGTKVHPAVQLATATSTGTMSRCIPAYPANMHSSVLKIQIFLSRDVFLMLTSILCMFHCITAYPANMHSSVLKIRILLS